MTANTKNKRCPFCSATDIVRGLAWFTTQAKVTLNSGDLSVKAPASLKIKAAKIQGNAISSATDYTITGGGGNLGAVSSTDGQKFFAPSALKDSYENTDFVAWSSATSNVYKDYFKYNIAVTSALGDNVKKGLAMKVTVNNVGDTLKDWYRIAVYRTGTVGRTNTTTDNVDALTGDELAPVAGEKWLFGDATGTNDAVSAASTITENGQSVTGILAGGRVVDVNIPVTTKNVSFYTDVANYVTAHFVVAVWLEGCAATVQNNAAGESISVTVDFSLRALTSGEQAIVNA